MKKKLTSSKKIIYSPFLHENLYQKLKKSFSNFIPNDVTSNILNEDYIDLVFEEVANDKDFKHSDTKKGTSESV